MGKLELLYIARSDGKLSVKAGKVSKAEPNEPTKLQREKKKDKNGVINFYRAVPIGDPKSMDWRKKLGGMLFRELLTRGEVPEEYRKNTAQFILADFPENYRLYEHRRVSSTNGSGENAKVGKGDTRDRRDVYLYGHPDGRKKRFRSPADFFPHLLWMATDRDLDSKDRDVVKEARFNCRCKICVTDDNLKAAEEMLEYQIKARYKVMPKVEPKIKLEDNKTTEKAPQSTTMSSLMAAQAGNLSNYGTVPMVVIDKNPMLQKQEKLQKPTPKPQQAITQNKAPQPSATLVSAPPRSISGTPLPAPRNYEQVTDSECNKFLYRPGELVWYQRGTAWAIAIIIGRDSHRDQRHQHVARYTIQPLSHPFHHPSVTPNLDQNLIRPWLAWSAPDPTNARLMHNPALTYETIDWRNVLAGSGEAEAVIDGSLFAAKLIDSTFTPFEPLSAPDPLTREIKYNGLYCGAERIWLGEPLRMRTRNVIMILHHIVEKPTTGPTAATTSEISLIGDVYTFETIPRNPRRTIPEISFLPLRVREDLKYRNRITERKNEESWWKPTETQRRISIADIKGRWYESRHLLPALRGDKVFEQDLKHGEISDAGNFMNARGDVNASAGFINTKKNDRVDAFGSAVPRGTQIQGQQRYIPPQQPQQPLAFPVDPALTAPSATMGISHPQDTAANDVEMLDFLDVDQLDEAGFGDEYLGRLGNNEQF